MTQTNTLQTNWYQTASVSSQWNQLISDTPVKTSVFWLKFGLDLNIMTIVFIKTQNNTTAQVASQQIYNLIQILNSVEKNKQVKYSVVESNRVHLL